MGSLPWKARIYIILLTALMAGAVLFSILAIGTDWTYWIVALAAAATIAALDHFNVRQFGVQIEVSVSNAIKFALVLLYPIPVVILGIFMGTSIGEISVKRAWFKKLFNIAELTITWVVATWVYSVFSTQQADYFGSPENILAVVLAGSTAFAVNIALVCLVISLAAHLPFPYVLIQNFKVGIWHEASLFTLGLFLAVLWRFNPVSIVLAGLPLFVVRDSYRTANHLRNQTQDALRALVRVVDERDHHTFNHSENVSNYSRSMAEALDLSQDDIEVIASAALLHDLGKVGMADDILFNPKLLSPEERGRAENHAVVGAMLLSKFPLFDKGAVLVRHHHEHYDGKGYPDRLKGEAIPLGARIISVADAYQAMTEDRPYRRALSQTEAIARLVEGSGTQFDPRVVQTFVEILRERPAEVTPAVATLSQSAEA
jgi:putative nucleotidyltransferase with HDIG domain